MDLQYCFATLKALLSSLTYLDLTGHVTFDNAKRSCASGSYGDIYKGRVVLSGREVSVAIKRLRFYLTDREIAKLAAKEIHVWSKLKHQNVLQLLGYISDESGFPSLISEWMDNGSALEYVRRDPQCNVLRLVDGIAKGLAYLHENDVVHSDIKSDNILISSSGDAKICDFGISRAINTTQAALGGNTTNPGGPMGSVRWVAYELLARSEEYTKPSKESDVWAFGMTVHELLTMERPYAHIVNDFQVIMSIISKKLPSCPIPEVWSKEKENLWTICRDFCWTWDPAQRIQMKEVVKKLSDISSAKPDGVARKDGMPLLDGLNNRESTVSISAMNEDPKVSTKDTSYSAPNHDTKNCQTGLGYRLMTRILKLINCYVLNEVYDSLITYLWHKYGSLHK